MDGKELLAAYFRAPVGSDLEKSLGKQFDKLVDTNRPEPPPRVRSDITETRKRYRIQNKDKINQWSRTWRAENKEKFKTSDMKWRANNRSTYNAGRARWKKNHPEKVLQMQRDYRKRLRDEQLRPGSP